MTTQTLPTIETDTDYNLGYIPMYKVLIHNDEATTFDFVMSDVLMGIFRLNRADAHRITMETHSSGQALVGTYTFERAEFLIDRSVSLARGRGFPLALSMEPA